MKVLFTCDSNTRPEERQTKSADETESEPDYCNMVASSGICLRLSSIASESVMRVSEERQRAKMLALSKTLLIIIMQNAFRAIYFT